MALNIVLIHGTFAPKAPWTKSGSDFCENLILALEPAKVNIIAYTWSGVNSHKARVEESKRLANLLETMSSETKSKITLICHSHGGNLALYALNKLEKIQSRFNVVTIATPFLNSTSRDFTNNLNLHFTLVPISICFILLITIMILVNYILQILPFQEFMSEYGLLIFFVVEIFVLLQFVNLGSWLYKYLQTNSSKLTPKINKILADIHFSEKLKKINILSVVDHSDEIKIWFGNISRVWELLLKTHNLLCSMVKWLWTAALFSIVALVFLFIFSPQFPEENIIFKIYMLVSSTLLSLALLLPWISFTLPAIFFFIKSNPLVLGWESWIHQMFIKTIPATTPFGLTNLKFIQYNIKKQEKFTLRHSLYEENEVINDIAIWIKDN